MKKKIMPMLSSLIILLLLLICVIAYTTQDRSAPKITYSDKKISYTQGDDMKILLADVRAVDAAEGDVTSTLTVESIRILSGGEKACVTYVARDSRNNIAKKSRIVYYQATEEKKEQSDPSLNSTKDNENSNTDNKKDNGKKDTADTTGQNTEDITNQDTTDKTNQNTVQKNNDTTGTEADDSQNQQEEPIKSTGVPVIKLKEDTVTISAGDRFNPMNYIDQAVDDKDDAWRRIAINGNYSTNTPGEYKLRYSITDRDGNHSNTEVLTLIVQ